MFAYGILKIIYSPFKTFQEIAQRPRIIGPLLIMLLFVAASVGREYTRASKFYVQDTTPEFVDPYNPDPWTENCTIWTSKGNISCNSKDTVLGYTSIQSYLANATEIQMRLAGIGHVDCSGTHGYENISFALKWIHPEATSPQKSTLYLFSDTQEYFYTDLTAVVGQMQNGTWKNITIPLANDFGRWLNSSLNASWDNITGLELELVWAETARGNLTMLIDKVFFQSDSFQPLLNMVSGNIVLFALDAVMGFPFYWILFSFVLFIIARLLQVKGELKIFLVIVGYTLIALVVMELLFIIFYALVPPLYFSVDSTAPSSVLQTMILFSLSASLLRPVWSIVLSIIGVRVVFELPLGKSAIIGVVGFLPYYVLLFLA